MKIKKPLAIGTIFLFIGIAVTPLINYSVVKASTDNDLVEVTTQACGIKGFGDTTVKLTREQYLDLEQYLVEFRARLNQTSTKEEVTALYKEAIVELNDYGLLPKGLSIPLAERLVIGNNLYDKFPGFFKRVPLLDLNDIENAKCFVYAEGFSGDFPLWFYFLFSIGAAIALKLLYAEKVILFMLLFLIGYSIAAPVMLFSTLNPIHILSVVELIHGDNNKLMTISFLPFKILEKDAVNRDYELFGYTGLKIITPDIEYFYGRTLLVINQH